MPKIVNNMDDLPTIGFDVSASFEIPIPWDILVSASDSCLQGYAPGFVKYEIVKKLPASTTYRLWQNELGELGTVEFRKLGASNSEIGISGVPMNSVDTAPMWLVIEPEWDKRINDALKGRRRIQEQSPEMDAYLAISNELDKAKAKIKAKQKNHQADVIKAYFNRLLYDLALWTSNKVIPPPYLIALVGLTEWPDKRNLSQEAREYFEKYKLEISNSDIQEAQNSLGKAKDIRRRGKSGRPSLPGDVWAWEQVNKHSRPMNEVYKEWIIRDDVQTRNSQDPNRQFNRITKPAWGNKSGQNI